MKITLSKAVSTSYRVSRALATASAASRGPKALIRQQVRRKAVYRPEFKFTRSILRKVGL